MKFSLITLICVVSLFSVQIKAQKTNVENKTYKVWVTKTDHSKIVKGTLHNVEQESISVFDNRSDIAVINASDIETIKIRKKGKVGNGILLGTLAGAAAGGIGGLVSGDDPDTTKDLLIIGTVTFEGTKASEKAVGAASILGISGGIVGAIIASKKEKFHVKGDVLKYQSIIDKLKTYSTSN